ncbi:MAG TPA: hypothetical protein EYP57_10195 [Thermodesulfobacteriaceae bacterium]|nr:hypothetical protein [Thermodesulfobacteriaceae bacterium]
MSLVIYVPEFRELLMYFENQVMTVDLDSSFLRDPETARAHTEAITSASGQPFQFLTPDTFTTTELPDISVHFTSCAVPGVSAMFQPESVSDI